MTTLRISKRADINSGGGKRLYEEKKSAVTAAVEAGKKAYEKEKERLSKG